MKEQIRTLKLNLKQIASSITQQKKLRKKNHPHHDLYQGDYNLLNLRSEFRHKHVAYCLARGRSLEKIDSGLGLDMDRVNWLIKAIQPDHKEKLYVVVNQKLTPAQQAVQSAHAVASFLKKHPNTLWTNGHLILLKDTPNYSGDMNCTYALDNCESANFIEPDIGNKITAYAVFGWQAEKYMKTKVLL